MKSFICLVLRKDKQVMLLRALAKEPTKVIALNDKKHYNSALVNPSPLLPVKTVSGLS